MKNIAEHYLSLSYKEGVLTQKIVFNGEDALSTLKHTNRI